jgi:hypothetical protein
MPGKLDALLAYCEENGRICPQPHVWDEFYQMLPEKRRSGGGMEPSAPLILAAWWEAPLLVKMLRLREHIHWAADHGAIDEADAFLRSLCEDHWFHGKD